MVLPNTPIVNSGLKYVNGLQLSFVDTQTLQIEPGACRDFFNVTDIILKTPIQIKYNVIGAGGFQSPPIANNHYAVYLIGDTNEYKPTSAILSLYNPTNSTSTTPPILPEGYDSYRRVGWAKTNSATPIPSFRQFKQYGTASQRQYIFGNDLPSTSEIGVLIATFTNLAPNVLTRADLLFGIGADAGVPAIPTSGVNCLLNFSISSGFGSGEFLKYRAWVDTTNPVQSAFYQDDEAFFTTVVPALPFTNGSPSIEINNVGTPGTPKSFSIFALGFVEELE